LVVSTIDSYQFGLIVVGGERFTSDIIISQDGVKDKWGRRRGHQLCLDDVVKLVTGNPDVLVIGTGALGLMRVLPEAQQAVNDLGIRLIAETTDEACRTYNQLCRSHRVVAAFHITC